MVTSVEDSVRGELDKVQYYLTSRSDSRKKLTGDDRYCFLAVSEQEGYIDTMRKVIKDYDSLSLVNVAPLDHLPSNGKSYKLATFRLKNGSSGK